MDGKGRYSMDTRFCSICTKRDICKEICKPLKSYLKTTKSDKELLGLDTYSQRHIKRKDIHLDPGDLEWLAGMRAMRLSLGMTDKSDMTVTEENDPN